MKFPSVSGLLQVAATLPAAFFVLGFFGRIHWALDLFSHFRAQYAAALLICAAAFALLRRRTSAAISLLAGLAITVTILLSSRPLPPPGDGPRLKLISYNVNTSNTQRQEVLQFLEKEDADVMFLMETDTSWLEALQPLEAAYPYRMAFPRKDNFGMAIYSRVPFRGKIEQFGEYGLPWADLTVAGAGIRIVAIHPLPPANADYSRLRDEQLSEVAATVHGSSRTVLCGDLNLTPYSPWFPELLRRTGLRSTAPALSPTWMSNLPLFAVPIDHVLLSPDLTLASRKVGPSLGSDHNALIVEITAARAASP